MIITLFFHFIIFLLCQFFFYILWEKKTTFHGWYLCRKFKFYNEISIFLDVSYFARLARAPNSNRTSARWHVYLQLATCLILIFARILSWMKSARIHIYIWSKECAILRLVLSRESTSFRIFLSDYSESLDMDIEIHHSAFYVIFLFSKLRPLLREIRKKFGREIKLKHIWFIILHLCKNIFITNSIFA